MTVTKQVSNWNKKQKHINFFTEHLKMLKTFPHENIGKHQST